MDCNDVTSLGSLALDGSLPIQTRSAVAGHIKTCPGCGTYLDQMATTEALLASRPEGPPRPTSRAGAGSGTDSERLAQNQRLLMKLARAADAAHADDLVQETWDHFLSASPATVPERKELATYLLQHVRDHEREEDKATELWADSFSHYRHNAADLAESDLPADPGSYDSLRSLADLDALDPDSDHAELLLPDLYDDGPDKGAWVTPPTAWPTVARILNPDDEIETKELYSVLDAALDELPGELGDLLYLVDIEGQTPQAASGRLQRHLTDVQPDLARARNHVRGRLDDYLSGR